MSTVFNNLSLSPGPITFIALGNGKYIESGAALGAPVARFSVTPGRELKNPDGTLYRRMGWTFSDEEDVVVNGVTQREKVVVSVQVTAGLNISDATINAVIDRAAAFPDSGRSTVVAQGGS